MIALPAPTRLHFGLFHVPAAAAAQIPGVRHFGGLGLLLRSPGIAIAIEAAENWSATGPSAERALAFARRVVQQFPLEFQRPLRIAVESCPPEHIGLGIGTQLGLAVADAAARELLGTILEVEELAKLAGRGERSRIGVGGYRGGGFIVDGGQKPECPQASTILHRESWPPDWRVVLLRPRGAIRWHGERERGAFARPRDAARSHALAEQLQKLAFDAVLPALQTRDFPEFCVSLHEFNRRAGEPFAADQRGVYSCPAVADMVDAILRMGIRGVGQSSWGPTVFAITADPDRANDLINGVPNWESAEIAVVSPIV